MPQLLKQNIVIPCKSFDPDNPVNAHLSINNIPNNQDELLVMMVTESTGPTDPGSTLMVVVTPNQLISFAENVISQLRPTVNLGEICECDLRHRRWNPNTHKCETCGRKYSRS